MEEEKTNGYLNGLEVIINEEIKKRINAIKNGELPSTAKIEFLNEIYLLLKIKKEL